MSMSRPCPSSSLLPWLGAHTTTSFRLVCHISSSQLLNDSSASFTTSQVELHFPTCYKDWTKHLQNPPSRQFQQSAGRAVALKQQSNTSEKEKTFRTDQNSQAGICVNSEDLCTSFLGKKLQTLQSFHIPHRVISRCSKPRLLRGPRRRRRALRLCDSGGALFLPSFLWRQLLAAPLPAPPDARDSSARQRASCQRAGEMGTRRYANLRSGCTSWLESSPDVTSQSLIQDACSYFMPSHHLLPA